MSKFIKNSIELISDTVWNIDTMTSGKIGTLGKFQKNKEIETLLESYYKIDVQLRNNVTLIGDFPNSQLKIEYLNKIEFLKLQDEVILTGFLDKKNVIENLRDLNVFVCTSSSEGFPNALLEAASIGVPIVVTAFGGIEDYCENGKNALIVPIGDTESIVQAITSILRNKELAQHLSNGAIDFAKSLSPDSEKNQWVHLYQEQLKLDFQTNFKNKQYV
jgi:glycosyltransferase involved in cell wall biosynthesis